ncbi:MAG: hypothetical protein KG003_02300 [Bacteroidetes bacterium]|nr:hypothetical protein [Bacteroidota bacterium]
MVKLFLGTLMFVGMAKQCSKVDLYFRLDQNAHPAILVKIDSVIRYDQSAADSAQRSWAAEFSAEFNSSFIQYHPDKKTIHKLRRRISGVSIKVVGGNWCSDTRRELPKLCKVLYYSGLSADSLEYYRVDRDKKAIYPDFATGWTKAPIPDIAIYRNGKVIGHIFEVTRKSMEEDLLKILK